MSDFFSDRIAKTSLDRRNVKNQFAGTDTIDEYSMMKMENVIVELSNLIITVDGVIVVKRRWDWVITTDLKKGTKSPNMRWDNGVLQVG